MQHDPVGALHQGHRRTQTAECLGKFAADGTAADNSQPWRQFFQVPDGLVGQVIHVSQTFDGRDEGPCASTEQEPAGTDLFAVHGHGLIVNESGRALDDVYPFGLKNVRRLALVYLLHHGSDPAHHRLEVDDRLR